MPKVKIVFCDFEGVEVLPGGDLYGWPTRELIYLGQAKRLLNSAGIIAIDMTGRPAGYMGAALQARGMLSDIWHSYEAGAVFRRMVPPGTMFHPLLTDDVLTRFDAIKSQLRLMAHRLGAIEEHGKAVCLSFNPTGDMSVEELYGEIMNYVAKMPDVGLLSVKHSKSAVDINPFGVSKGTALEFLCRGYGVDLAETAGIGDTMGDKDMLERVGYPMCVANATPDVKALVDGRGGFVSQYAITLGAIDCLAQLAPGNRTISQCFDSCLLSWGRIYEPFLSPLEWVTPSVD